ncbi:MAG: DUF4783 domain-containing protein [Bacteroidales bacterium]|nr:DUF4783 domain-containing protein [Bacteroidales bacterium]
MKRTGFIIFILALFVFAADVYGFTTKPPADVSNEVSSAIRSGNARDVAKHFGSNVDLKFPGNEGTFSRNQAELIVRNFFTRNAPASFSVQHQGPSRDGSLYVIGNYRTSNGDAYRVYFLIKTISGNTVLHLLQFEKQ